MDNFINIVSFVMFFSVLMYLGTIESCCYDCGYPVVEFNDINCFIHSFSFLMMIGNIILIFVVLFEYSKDLLRKKKVVE